MKLRHCIAMAMIAAVMLFALSSRAFARAGPEKDQAVTHQAMMVNAGEIAVQPSALVTPALYTTNQFEMAASAKSRRANSAHLYDGSSTILWHQRQQPAVVQIE